MRENKERNDAIALMHKDLEAQGLSKSNIRLAVTQHFWGDTGKNPQQMNHAYRQKLSVLCARKSYEWLAKYKMEVHNKKETKKIAVKTEVAVEA